MITLSQRGNFNRTEKYLKRLLDNKPFETVLEKYGEKGVAALRSATPVDTGKTAESWYYEIVKKNGSLSIQWKNSNINRGVQIAVIIQYGHATKNGGYVRGVDYINPALRPIFNEIAESAWKEVTKV